MRRRHTTSTDPDLMAGTTQRAYRIPTVQLEAVKQAIASGIPDIHNVTDAVVDALWLWVYEYQRTWKNAYGPVTVQLGPENDLEPVEFKAPTMDDAVLDEADHPYTGHHERPTWSDVDLAAIEDG